MMDKSWKLMLAVIVLVSASASWADDFGSTVHLRGTVTDSDGKAVPGAMVSAIDAENESLVTVYADKDGKYAFPALAERDYSMRARWIGFEDEVVENVKAALESGSEYEHKFQMAPASDLQSQRTAETLISMIDFDSEEQRMNFRMACTYCHQVGTVGFRTPEEPVDWEVMVTRMDGFGMLHKETQEVLVDKLLATYSPEAMAEWPAYEAPAAPLGKNLDAVITQWSLGPEDVVMMHDLEMGDDGLAYVVDMINDSIVTLDPATGERQMYPMPGGKEPYTEEVPIIGPHSIEKAANGDMWITCALSGKMAKFDTKTKEYTIVWSGENDRRGFYPHSLRIDQKGIIWYTDAAMNSIFKIHPETHDVKRYELLRLDDVPRSNVRGEGGAIVPYGVDIAPDGKIWYSKLNGQRIGRLDPETEELKEWAPPVRGPRRLQVAANGIVWVPGFGSGNFASFNPETEEWKVYDLPGNGNALPYALSIHPDTGDIWICGTGMDNMMRFDPKTEEMTEYPMPNRVTYTREIEFDEDGNVWVCNSNYPSRHIEDHRGSVIKIAWQEDAKGS